MILSELKELDIDLDYRLIYVAVNDGDVGVVIEQQEKAQEEIRRIERRVLN